jgi:hypothetical protein
MIPISISRVNQFDAARLDIEMSAMLKEQLVKVFSLMKVSFLVHLLISGHDSSEYIDLMLLVSIFNLFLLCFGVSQECYFNMSQNLMLSLSFSFGGSLFG